MRGDLDCVDFAVCLNVNRNNEPIANRTDTEIIKPNSKRMEMSSILEIKK